MGRRSAFGRHFGHNGIRPAIEAEMLKKHPPEKDEATERPLSDEEAQIALEHAVKKHIRKVKDMTK